MAPTFWNTRVHLYTVVIMGIAGCSDAPTTPTSHVAQHPNAAETSVTSTTQAPEVSAADSQTRPVLEWRSLPFITGSDRAMAVIKPATMAASPAIGELLKALPFGKTDLKIPPADTEWLALYATPLINDDQSFTGVATMVIKLNRPASVYEVAESRFTTDQFEAVETDELSYLRAVEKVTDDYVSPAISGVDSSVAMAVFEYDERTFVICEEGRLPYILSQPNEENSLQPLLAKATNNFQVLIAADIEGDQMLREAAMTNGASFGKDGVLESLAKHVNTVVLTANLDTDALVELFATTSSESGTVAIEESFEQFRRSANGFLQEMELLSSADTKPLISTSQQLLEKLLIARNASNIAVKVCAPDDLSPFFKSLQVLLGQEVAAIETN